MTRISLIRHFQTIEMARNCCLLAGKDPDEVVAGYFVDAAGQRQRVSKARWRWYRDAEQESAERDTEPTVAAECSIAAELSDKAPQTARERGRWMSEVF